MPPPAANFRRLYIPDLLFANGQLHPGQGLLVDPAGGVAGYCTQQDAPDAEIIALPCKALLPGLANAHSHTFQRLFRGRAEGRAIGGDTFWTWREQMYRAAAFLSPEDLYDVARAAFLEMACAGITTVGEFHYLHRDPQGCSYRDPNLLAKTVIAAARSVGMRICLLRSAYARAGFGQCPHPGQIRFYEDRQTYLNNLADLVSAFSDTAQVSIGAAPHSIRAVPLDQLKEIAQITNANMPLHLHISEQTGENDACLAEYGTTPVDLLAHHDILSSKTTLIHAIHLAAEEQVAVAQSGATICSCPTTERNLGDGIFPADRATNLGIPIALGTDSQAQIDILEDARQLEYHLRLRDQQRGILDASASSSIGETLFRAATANGYKSLGIAGGTLAIGEVADFFTVDLNDLSILGLNSGEISAEAITAQIVFALSKSAIRDAAVDGQLILTDGQHPHSEEIRSRYREVHRRFLNHAK